MHSAIQIESELTRGMKRIAVPYRAALDILRAQEPSSHSRPGQGLNSDSTAGFADMSERLRPSMEMIAAYEGELAPLRDQWNQLQKSPSADLRNLIDEQALLLKELIARLDDVELQMLSSRKQLTLRLDESQLRNNMREAYQSTRDSPQ